MKSLTILLFGLILGLIGVFVIPFYAMPGADEISALIFASQLIFMWTGFGMLLVQDKIVLWLYYNSRDIWVDIGSPATLTPFRLPRESHARWPSWSLWFKISALRFKKQDTLKPVSGRLRIHFVCLLINFFSGILFSVAVYKVTSK